MSEQIDVEAGDVLLTVGTVSCQHICWYQGSDLLICFTDVSVPLPSPRRATA